MKIYISGKMRGLPEDESRRLFKAAENYLVELGHDVINPWDSEDDKKRQCKVWADFILYDLQILKTCDAIFMLSNWQDSDGAKCEHAFASGRHMKIIYDTPERDRYQDGFNSGVWYAIQDLIAVYCEPVLATDILNAFGMSIEEIEKAQEVSGCYDVQMSAFIEQLKMTARKKKSGNTSYKDISELSVEVKNKIYELRFPCDKNVTIDEYIGHYCLIIVDDVAYVGDDEFSHKLLKQWLLTDSKIKKAALAHAIIVNNHVIKNRFGITK